MKICVVQASKFQLEAAEVVENSAKARDKLLKMRKTRDEKIAERFANVMKIKQSLLMKRTQSLQGKTSIDSSFYELEINAKEIVVKQKRKLVNVQIR
ncbi:hypothetical protein ACPA9J_16975 [Pseudomonas aeruginosa]